MLNISKYNSFIFDCDGVILDSNRIKTTAFHQTALPFGKEEADMLVGYHTVNGGISRYEKFRYFIVEILKEKIDKNVLNSLISTYAGFVKADLIKCPIAANLEEIRSIHRGKNWLIASGGDQDELREVFTQRKIGHLFDGGIFGSPDKKEDILKRELKNTNIIQPAILFGDSLYDYKAAISAGVDFIFVSGWTELKDWGKHQQKYNFHVVEKISDFLVNV